MPAPAVSPSDGTPLNAPDRRVAQSVEAELKAAGTKHGFCMPQTGKLEFWDVLGVGRSLKISSMVRGVKLGLIGVADPKRSGDREHMKRVEEVLEKGGVTAFKCYLGYEHIGPESEVYRAYYPLAKKYKIPVIFHTGDTYSRNAKVKYAHPLRVDEVAVDYPDVNFVLAHMGNPWARDAAEVVYKNNQFGIGNVYADLSALFVVHQIKSYGRSGILARIEKDVKETIAYSERPDRFLFGSDWPLNNMAAYRNWVAETVPAEHHRLVFFENGMRLFGLEPSAEELRAWDQFAP